MKNVTIHHYFLAVPLSFALIGAEKRFKSFKNAAEGRVSLIGPAGNPTDQQGPDGTNVYIIDDHRPELRD